MKQTDSVPSDRSAPGRALGMGTRIGYGIGDFGFVAAWQGAALFLLYFYTDVLHLSPWTAGAIYLTGMIWDAVSDPLIASQAERFAARTGNYGALMRRAALPLGLSYVLMFSMPDMGTALTTVAALIGHLIFRTAYTYASMPYNTLPLRLTTDGDERSSLSALRVIGAALGGLTVAIATPLLVDAMSVTGERAGYLLAATVMGGLVVGILLVSSLATREPSRHRTVAANADTGRDLAELWSATRRNGPLQRLLVMMMLATIGFALFTQSQLYFLNHVLDSPGITAPVLAGPALAMIVTAPLWMLLAARTSKRNAMIAGLLVATAGYALMGLAPVSGTTVALGAVCLIGAGSAAIPVMFWSMLPDAIDHGELLTGMRIEARTFGLTTFVQKCSAGLAALLTGGLLALAGYTPDAAIGAGAASVITAMVSWIPAAFMMAMVMVIHRYPISRDTHSAVIEELARRTDRS
ncbi:MFS transporter [Maricaulis sp.]|uniref:MFS transporter n=1 Tax=Maricaulis sp. TaxID=1486257 RepID=UPI002B2664F8|nr:MFS transporter [Maricaulis sp.]